MSRQKLESYFVSVTTVGLNRFTKTLPFPVSYNVLMTNNSDFIRLTVRIKAVDD